MKNLLAKSQYEVSKKLSHVKSRWILVVLILILVVVAFGPLIKCGDIGKDISDMLSPVSLRNFSYQGETSEHNGLFSTIAYALGLIFISGFIIPIVTNYIRTLGDKYVNGTLSRYHWKNHVLFLGYDELIAGTLFRLCQTMKEQDGGKIVVAVPDGVGTLRARLQEIAGNTVEVIQCRQNDVNNLQRRACVQAARKIFVIGQPDDPTHDASILASLGIIATLRGPIDVKDSSIHCMYYIRNQATFYLLQRESKDITPAMFKNVVSEYGLEWNDTKMTDFYLASEPFNVFESMARHLLVGELSGVEGMRLEGSEGQDPHLVVIGMSSMGTALARLALMIAHCPKKTLHVTMVDEHAYEEMLYFVGRHRYFFENSKYSYTCFDDHSHDIKMPEKAKLDFLDVEVEFIQCNIASPHLTQYLIDCIAKNNNHFLNVAVCTDDSPKNMAFALYLPRQILEAQIPVWVYQNGDDSMNSFLKSPLYQNVHVFSPTEYGVVADRSVSVEWKLAKAVSNGYESRNNKGKPITPWNKQQPMGKWSSLYGGISKILMLRSMGVDPFSIRPLSKEEEDSMSKTEHNRWCAEKLLNGFVPTSEDQHNALQCIAVKNDLKKYFIHDDIRPYEKLDDNTQEKDKDQINDVLKELNDLTSQHQQL